MESFKKHVGMYVGHSSCKNNICSLIIKDLLFPVQHFYFATQRVFLVFLYPTCWPRPQNLISVSVTLHFFLRLSKCCPHREKEFSKPNVSLALWGAFLVSLYSFLSISTEIFTHEFLCPGFSGPKLMTEGSEDIVSF